MRVGWLEILSCPRHYKPYENDFFSAFFPGDHCRDQEAMRKIGMSPVCCGCTLCYNKLELRADE